MTLDEFSGLLKERWQTIAACVVLFTLLGALLAITTPSAYSTSSTLYVSAQTADSANAAYQGSMLSEQRVTSYTELVTNERVAKEVRTRLGLSETPDQIVAKLEATSAADSVVINVAATDEDPARAAAIANAAAEVFSGLVDQLERPTTPGAIQPVAVRIVQPAEVPDAPSSTSPWVYLLAGVIFGALVGFAAAYIRARLDRSVKDSAVLAQCSGAPQLGAVPYSDAISRDPLSALSRVNSAHSESLRQLRTNLQFIDIDHPRRVIAVTSSLPGEGKTTTVVNLATVAASGGLRVLLIDGDLRRPQIARMSGLADSVGLSTVLIRRITMRESIQRWNDAKVDVLASGPVPPNPSELLGSQQMKNLLIEAGETYDLVLIDTPPLLPVTDAAIIAAEVDGAILVCQHKQTRIDQVEGSVEALRTVSAKLLGTVLTMTPRAKSAYGEYYSPYGSRHTVQDVHSSEKRADDEQSETTAEVPRPTPFRRSQA